MYFRRMIGHIGASRCFRTTFRMSFHRQLRKHLSDMMLWLFAEGFRERIRSSFILWNKMAG